MPREPRPSDGNPGLPPPYRIPVGGPSEDTKRMIEMLALAMFGRSPEDAVKGFVCIDPECNRVVTPNSFRTPDHRRCYEVAGLCQRCQDEMVEQQQ